MSDQYLFKLFCKNCSFTKLTNGTQEDLKDLHEMGGCSSCSGRKFKCPKCGHVVKLAKNRSR